MKIHSILKFTISHDITEFQATASDDDIATSRYNIKFRVYGNLTTYQHAVLVNHPLSYGTNILNTEDEKGWWDIFCRRFLGEKIKNTIIISISLHEILDNTHVLKFSVRDFSHIQKAVLDSLGITIIDYIIGGSLGGITTADFICSYPTIAKNAIIISAAHKSYGNHIYLRKLQELLINNTFNNNQDMSVAAKLLSLFMYKSPQYFDQYSHDLNNLCFNDKIKTNQLCPKNWLKIKSMLDGYDITNDIYSIQANIYLICSSSDNYYPYYQNEDFYNLLINHKKLAKLIVVKSDRGHDAFLSDQQNFADQILLSL
ncbi:MAG: alpha/beta hydrolase family protein [Gammaproteobacteria bacterium]